MGVCKGKKLFDRFNGVVTEYSRLPDLAKKAVDVFYKEELVKQFGDQQPFGYVLVPLNEIIKAVQESDDCYADFAKYHVEDMALGDVPIHNDIWPVILDADFDEVIWDGWHRFHCYVDKQIETVPAIWPMFGS
jgi:hypothetical protein